MQIPTAGFMLGYLARLAIILLPISADPALSQVVNALFLASLGVLLVSIPVSVLAFVRDARRRRSAGSPNRAT
jgi:hypothetical protein